MLCKQEGALGANAAFYRERTPTTLPEAKKAQAEATELGTGILLEARWSPHRSSINRNGL